MATDVATNDDGGIILKKGATKHCCYGLCNSDSRYADREHMEGVGWLPFPKLRKDPQRCQRWVAACRREGFTVDKIRKWTYICTKHFVGGNGPTPENPDPVPANFTAKELEKIAKKRKPPRTRTEPVSKKTKLAAAETLMALSTAQDHLADDIEVSDQAVVQHIADHHDHGEVQPQDITALDQINRSKSKHQENEAATDVPTLEKETQTKFACSELITYKIDAIVSKRSVKKQCKTSKHQFSYDSVSSDGKQFHFYTGLTHLQFQHLFSWLGPDVENLNYWRGSKTTAKKQKKGKCKLSPKNQLFLMLVKLRQAFPNKDLAYRFNISVATVSGIINTWIQFLYVRTANIRKAMFPSRQIIKEHMPPCFKSFKNARVIIDCFEVFAQQPRNFSEQGNMYSSYKNHCTFKALVGIAPTGGISFLSDVFEGSISDKEIVKKSGLLNLLNPGDLVIADRGFDIKEILQGLQVSLNIPPFLKNRERLTPQEEIVTKRIARVRIHVERAIERMKKYKIIGRTVPLNLKPVITQMVHVIGFLVNYQQPIVK